MYPIGLTAVDCLDLSVGGGEIFGLLGPNGAGKTTTVGMLTTRVVPTSGTAVVGGVDVVAHPAVAKQAIGVVHQTNTLDRSLTVWENLYFHGRYFGMSARGAREAADRVLGQFRLADRAKADVAALSGGMAQRLMVARAFITEGLPGERLRERGGSPRSRRRDLRHLDHPACLHRRSGSME